MTVLSQRGFDLPKINGKTWFLLQGNAKVQDERRNRRNEKGRLLEKDIKEMNWIFLEKNREKQDLEEKEIEDKKSWKWVILKRQMPFG